MIRPAHKTTGPHSVEDFFALVKDGEKADLINGVIYMASPDSPRANDIGFFVGSLLRYFVAERSLGGRCYISRVAFELDDSHAPEPDVAYVRGERMHLVASGRVKGAPDIAVEIVSHDSVNRDYELKRDMYEAAGVPEYWIIDPIDNSAEFLVLRDGRYKTATLEDGARFRSTVLPGFWLDTRWLFATPLPKEPDCLQQILAG
ncbi:MAG: Uma2 family endonuclease [Planctomycetia bacterium]|nr:Uma2 family endonuclease [Planctomycetia bacterium]